MAAYLLGVDIGTSGTKTVLFDTVGRTIASATLEYPMAQPQIGWAEQDPEDWWQASAGSIAAVIKKSGVDPSLIQGIGLSGQMHGMVLLDADGQVLRPAIIWCDQRTAKEVAQMNEIVGRERMIEITANPPTTGFTAAKILWVKNNQPEIFEKTRKVLLPKDYVRYRLTGEFASEVSDASGMQLLDVPKRQWSREVCDALGIPFDWLAPVYESPEVTGGITRQVAALTGLKEGTPVVGGGGDNAASAVGTGIVRTGIMSATIGSSGVVFAHLDEVSIDLAGRVHTFCHAVPGKWHIMGVTQGAGISLRWMRDEFCGMEKEMAWYLDIDPYELMTQQAVQAKPGCDGLIFLPYMMGERTPHLDPFAKGAFFGISNAHRRQEMMRAVMEGVSYSLLDGLEIIRGMGTPVSEIRAAGGGCRSAFWRQIMADMFDVDIVTTNSKEGPALGVALLAGVGTGIYASVPEACEAAIQCVTKQVAEEGAKKMYKQYYPVYKKLYTALKPCYDDVASILGQR